MACDERPGSSPGWALQPATAPRPSAVTVSPVATLRSRPCCCALWSIRSSKALNAHFTRPAPVVLLGSGLRENHPNFAEDSCIGRCAVAGVRHPLWNWGMAGLLGDWGGGR